MEIKTADFITSMADYGDFPGKGLPQIAVAGKSNVGKSTLINKLWGRQRFKSYRFLKEGLGLVLLVVEGCL